MLNIYYVFSKKNKIEFSRTKVNEHFIDIKNVSRICIAFSSHCQTLDSFLQLGTWTSEIIKTNESQSADSFRCCFNKSILTNSTATNLTPSSHKINTVL